MLQGLLEVAEVVRGDGPWSAGTGQQFESRGCATQSFVYDICDADGRFQLAGGPDGGAAQGRAAKPFAVVATLRRPVRCRLGDEKQFIADAVETETEKAVGRVLWRGVASGSGNAMDVWLADNPDVATASAGAGTKDAIANGLVKFWEIAVGAKPVLHLGIRSVLDLTTNGDWSNLLGTDVDIVVSPGYPADAVAVTGPIVINLGTVDAIETYQTSVNREMTEANRLAAIQFDPCHAVFVTGA